MRSACPRHPNACEPLLAAVDGRMALLPWQLQTDRPASFQDHRFGQAPWCPTETLEAASAQHAGNRARQQACAHRLGGPRTRSLLSAEDHHQCLTPARSGPPRGCPPPLCATVAHHIRRASDGGSCTSFTRSLEMVVPPPRGRRPERRYLSGPSRFAGSNLVAPAPPNMFGEHLPRTGAPAKRP